MRKIWGRSTKKCILFFQHKYFSTFHLHLLLVWIFQCCSDKKNKTKVWRDPILESEKKNVSDQRLILIVCCWLEECYLRTKSIDAVQESISWQNKTFTLRTSLYVTIWAITGPNSTQLTQLNTSFVDHFVAKKRHQINNVQKTVLLVGGCFPKWDGWDGLDLWMHLF